MDVANGGEKFVEIRDLLLSARAERGALASHLEHIEQLPVVALHPTIIAKYRAQGTKLNAALAENPEARLEAMPKLRTLIDHVIIRPDDLSRGVASK